MSRNRWMRASDAPYGDRDGLAVQRVNGRYQPIIRCPVCGAAIEIGQVARIMTNDDAYDECPECGVEVRVVVEWREAVPA